MKKSQLFGASAAVVLLAVVAMWWTFAPRKDHAQAASLGSKAHVNNATHTAQGADGGTTVDTPSAELLPPVPQDQTAGQDASQNSGLAAVDLASIDTQKIDPQRMDMEKIALRKQVFTDISAITTGIGKGQKADLDAMRKLTQQVVDLSIEGYITKKDATNSLGYLRKAIPELDREIYKHIQDIQAS